MEQNIRWKQRFENFDRAVKKLKSFSEIEQRTKDDISQVALIGAFEFTFELAWKTIKDYLKFNGVQVSLPREVIKQGFHHQLIDDGETWILMLEDRNILVHTYDEEAAKSAIKTINKNYIPKILQIHEFFTSKL